MYISMARLATLERNHKDQYYDIDIHNPQDLIGKPPIILIFDIKGPKKEVICVI